MRGQSEWGDRNIEREGMEVGRVSSSTDKGKDRKKPKEEELRVTGLEETKKERKKKKKQARKDGGDGFSVDRRKAASCSSFPSRSAILDPSSLRRKGQGGFRWKTVLKLPLSDAKRSSPPLLVLIVYSYLRLGYKASVHPLYLCLFSIVSLEINRWYGLFKVLEKLSSNAFRVDLPFQLRCHPVFNVSALKKYNKNVLEGWTVEPPPPITDLDGFQRYIVEKILSHRRRRGKLQYLVKWIGYNDATWEPEHFLKNEAGRDLEPLKRYKEINPHWLSMLKNPRHCADLVRIITHDHTENFLFLLL